MNNDPSIADAILDRINLNADPIELKRDSMRRDRAKPEKTQVENAADHHQVTAAKGPSTVRVSGAF